MNSPLYSIVRRSVLVTATVVAACMGSAAMAAPQPMDNEEMSEVSGGDGLSIIADLHINISRVSRSFEVDGATTYAVMDDVGGGMFVGGITVDVRKQPNASGDTYIDIGMPGYVSFNKFGFKTSAVQTSQQAAIAPNQNLGGVQLNGAGAMTGNFLLWAK